jgi:hypothetical protein
VKLAAMLALAIGIALLLLPDVASARSCSKRGPITAKGRHWIVYTGDSRRERREIPCRKARRIARNYIASAIEPGRWSCTDTRAVKQCVRGGTYIDRYGDEKPRYLIGWHAAD